MTILHNDYKNKTKTEYMKEWFAKHPGYKSQQQKDWRKRNPEKVKIYNLKASIRYKGKWAERDRKRRRNCPSDLYNYLYTLQNGCCAICSKQLNVLSVDHCHICSEVRKLLCKNCNSILGFAHDTPEILEKAALYLRDYNLHQKILNG